MISVKYPRFVSLLRSAKLRCHCSASESVTMQGEGSGELTTMRTRIQETTRISFIIKREEIINETAF